MEFTRQEIAGQTQARRDADERKGYAQGYVDGYRERGRDPIYASPDFRRGYLNGHHDGTLDHRAGYRSRLAFAEYNSLFGR
jgi:hypothetical protein